MILRIVVFSSQRVPMHTFIWTEGEETGVCLQHANIWIHPAHKLDAFISVAGNLVRRMKATIAVFYWDARTGHWWDLD